MRKNSKAMVAIIMVMASVNMIGCGLGSETDTAKEMEQVEQNVTAGQVNEPIDIQLLGDGRAYNIDEKCSVFETYDVYSVQADPDTVYKLLMHDNYEAMELRTHVVETADDKCSENGKYDVVDRVSVNVAFTDEFGLIPQRVTKEVVLSRDALSGNWKVTGETCKKWETKHKKLGGTSWKLATEEGDIYFRLRDTIEFFTTQPNNDASQANETQFSTTILSAAYMEVDGEYKLRRTHVLSGTLNDSGEIVLDLTFVGENESMTINLNDCEKIEKEELPFTEEEFREASDQLG